MRIKKYRALLGDPAWPFKVRSAKGTGRSAVSHYDVMTIDEIIACGPQIIAMATDDAVMFLWCPDNMIEYGLHVMAAWGFTFKTFAFVWVKRTKRGKWHFGNGFWTRANPEICLLGTRGHPKRLSAAVPKLIEAPVREHSRKPDETYNRIMRLVDGPYVELFSRQSWPGWDIALSDQAGLFDNDPVKTRRQPSMLGCEGPRERCHGKPRQLENGDRSTETIVERHFQQGVGRYAGQQTHGQGSLVVGFISSLR
jgi:N6-adenosine-specific RNA methylase IME4